MKDQALFSSKGKTKKLKCRLLQVLFGALRVKKYIDAQMTKYSVMNIAGKSVFRVCSDLMMKA